MGSFVMIPTWLIEKRVTPTAWVLYGTLAMYGHFQPATGRYVECRPAMATLVQRTGLSETTIKRALEELLSVGAVVRHLRHAPDGGSLPSMYEVIFNEPVENGRGGSVSGPPGGPLTDPNQEPNTKNPASLRSAGGSSEAAPQEVTARTILSDWIDYCTGQDVKLPSVHKARYGREIKALLASGFTERDIKRALAAMFAAGATPRPSELPNVIVRLQTGPEVRQRPVTPEEARQQQAQRARDRRRALIRAHGACDDHPHQPGGGHCPDCTADAQTPVPSPDMSIIAGLGELGAGFGRG